MILLPTLLCTTVAMADACWEIKKCGGTCQLSASSDTPSDRRYFQCGGNGGCANGAIIYAVSEYYKCGSNKWVKLDKDKLSDELSNVRECGDSNADNENTAQVWVDNDTYDFFRENKSGTFLDKSDICKKPKQAVGKRPKADVKSNTTTKPVAPEPEMSVTKVETKPETPKTNEMAVDLKTEHEQPKPMAEPVEKSATTVLPPKTEKNVAAVPAPGSTEQPKQNTEKAAPVLPPTPTGKNITITGTVVDDTNSPIPQVNIFVVDNETRGVAADDNGRYTINGLSADSKLKFSSIGFEPVEKTVADLNDNPNVVLKKTAVGLQEVTISPCADDEKFEHGKCVKIKTAEPAKEPAVEPVVATEPPTPTPKPTPEELEKRLKESQDALTAARDKENSWANRGVTAASSAMTGLGTMAAASAIAEQRSDAAAEKEMRAYIETMKCNYGGGQNIKLGNEEITLPGGNELLEYYTEYKSLADELKQTKTALGLRPGIESETLYDRAQSGLYQYASIGKTGGGETSLYRALTDSESEDATAWAEQKEETSKQLKTGGGVAVGGAATGVVGNAAINTDMIKNIKEAFKK